MLRVRVAERNVAARRICGREGEDDVLPRAVGDARGLEEQTIGRIEEDRESLQGGQVAREADVRERARDDERGDEQRQEHPRADEETPLTGGTGALFCEPTFSPRAQDGDGGGHGDKYTGKQVDR